MSNIGMMDGAFFVGRKEIMDWINETLSLNLSKVEETASGAVACQLLDIMYPGEVPMHKVNWAAKQDFEFVTNYKVLQTCFTKLHIDRHVDVDRLIKGRYQDNLEFMQWFKRFFEMGTHSAAEYDPVAQRARGKGGAQYNSAHGAGSARPKSGTSLSAPSKRAGPRAAASSSKVAKKPEPTKAAEPVKTKRTVSDATATIAPKTEDPRVTAARNEELEQLKAANESLSSTNAQLQIEIDGIEKERDFYFDKLRDIEMMLQDLEDNGNGNELTAAIFKILYAQAEDGEEDGTAAMESEVVEEAVDETY